MFDRPAPRRSSACLGALAFLLVGCTTAKVVSRSELAAAPSPGSRPTIYVADFELDAADVKSESLLPHVLSRPRVIGPLGLRQDPEAQAHQLIELMSRSIVENLTKAGLTAQRLAAGAAMPTEGWIVRGVFLEVDQGNRLRRAIIGFGAGATEMQVAATTDDLSKGKPAPLYEVDTSARSGRMPGAVVTLNPVVAGARFVLAGHDLERNVKDSAAKIAEDVEKRVKGGGPLD